MKEMYSEIAKYYFKPQLLWNNIPKHIHDELKAHSTIYKVKKNELIYTEGSCPRGLYIINKGVAKLYTITNTGQEQIIYILSKHEMFGYRAIASNNDSVIFISAIKDCEIELIDRDIFTLYLFKSIEFNKLFMNYFGEEFRTLCNRLSIYALKPVNERVALMLLVLNQKFNSGDGNNIIDFKLKDIANYSGVSFETLSRQLKILKEMGAIITKGRKITLTNLAVLHKRANI